jgi:hypothetical protein
MRARLSLPSLDRLFGPGWLALGFAYWLAMVCALEPGNLAGAETPPPLLREVTRLLAAGALGAAATPAVLAMAGAGQGRRRPGLAVQVLGVLALALVLILVSCVLAAWMFEQRLLPRLEEVRQELAANYVLLVFGLTIFLGLVLAVRARAAPPGDSLVFAERGRTLVIGRRDIEWVESQGNYQAVRASGATHLVRRTLDALEAELDPDRFVRIHRRTIVAVDAVRDVAALSNGDAEVRLADGQVFRASRGRRARLAAALDALAGR